MAGHAVDLAQDVPKGDVDAADGRSPDDSRAVPEVLAIHHLPEIFDAGRVLPDEELANVLDRTHHRPGMPLQRSLAPAVQPRLVGKHLHKHPVPHAGVTDEGFDFGDFHGRPLRTSSPCSASCRRPAPGLVILNRLCEGSAFDLWEAQSRTSKADFYEMTWSYIDRMKQCHC